KILVDYAKGLCRGRGQIGLALDGTRGHARDEVIDEERIQHGDRDGAQKRGCHQLAPKELVTMNELLRDADRDGLDQAVVHEDECVEELVPGKREREERGGKDAWQSQWDGDSNHGLDAGGAI